MRVNRSGGSRRKAVHIDAALSMCPALATIILTVALVGLTAEALVPDLAYDDLACLASSDPDNPTTNDCDDSSKPVSQSNPTRLVSHFAKALLATVDLALPRSLMPVHVLAGIDLVNQPLLPDYFLPNGVHGPTVRVGRGADAESRRDLLFLPLPGTASRRIARRDKFSASRIPLLPLPAPPSSNNVPHPDPDGSRWIVQARADRLSGCAITSAECGEPIGWLIGWKP